MTIALGNKAIDLNEMGINTLAKAGAVNDVHVDKNMPAKCIYDDYDSSDLIPSFVQGKALPSILRSQKLGMSV